MYTVNGLIFTRDMLDRLPVLAEMAEVSEKSADLLDSIDVSKFFIAYIYASTNVLPTNFDREHVLKALDFWGVDVTSLLTSDELRERVSASEERVSDFERRQFIALYIQEDRDSIVQMIYIPTQAILEYPIPVELPPTDDEVAPERINTIDDLLRLFDRLNYDSAQLLLFFAAIKDLKKMDIGVEIRNFSFDEDVISGEFPEVSGDCPAGWLIAKSYFAFI